MKPRPLAALVVVLLLLAGAWFAYHGHQAGPPSPLSDTPPSASTTGDQPASPSDSSPTRSADNSSKPPAARQPSATQSTVPSRAAGVSQIPPVQVIPPSQRPQNSAIPAYAAPLTPSGQPAHTEQDLEKINRMLRDYRTLMGENPVGTNAEIMRSIMGDNPRKAQLLQDGVTLNGSGEIVDPWGNPYFFHQLSGTLMEVRSAGPDGIMWTGDDIIRK